MDIQRNILTISLVAISAILYFKWIEFSAPENHAVNNAAQVIDTGVPSTPTAQLNADSGVPAAPTTITSNLPDVPETKEASNPDTLIVVETDIVKATINTCLLYTSPSPRD